MCEILKLYPTLHEAAEEMFVDTLNRRILRSNPPTQLQALRKAVGYSQKTLGCRVEDLMEHGTDEVEELDI